MTSKVAIWLILCVLLGGFAHAQVEVDEGDFLVGNFELEKILNFVGAIIAAGLLVVTFVAYKRTSNSRLLYVSAAFFFFVVRGLLTAHELFFDEWGAWVDPLASTLIFVILLCFFLGVLKK